jgi:hypothetical protein
VPNGLTVGGVNYPSTGPLSNRNKIINGAMVIDQRNAGAAVTLSAGAFAYPVDRFSFYTETLATSTAQRSSVAPQGFANSALYSVTTGATASAGHQNVVQYNAEGADVSSFGWGASGAQEITVSFWVQSSLVGTYGFSVSNSAFDRSYVAEYSVSVADTWEYKTIAIPGDTSGTWLKNNGIGIRLRWDLGSGSNYYATPGAWSAAGDNTTSAQANLIGTSGATWQITGVQLEAGDTATPFEHRSFGQELALCQRYFETNTGGAQQESLTVGSHGVLYHKIPFQVMKRANPTITYANATRNSVGFTPAGVIRGSQYYLGMLQNTAGAAFSSDVVVAYDWSASAEL